MSFNYQNFVFLSKKYTDKPSPFDAEMLFNIGAGYRFSGLWYCKGWELSAKFRYTCGILYTHFNGSRKLYFKQYNTEIFYDLGLLIWEWIKDGILEVIHAFFILMLKILLIDKMSLVLYGTIGTIKPILIQL